MEIKDKIEKIIGREITLVHPKSLDHGDYTLISDEKIAQEDFEKLQNSKLDSISKVEFVAPRFINFYLSKDFFKKSLSEVIEEGENFGKSEHAKGFKVMVEHTQPNPFKKFHVGHMMNNAIGEALSRVIKANGAEVKTVSYHGDVGMHVAKALWKGDYALGAQAYEEDEKAKAEIQDINKKVYEQSNPEINARYEEGKQKSLQEFEKMYQRLGSKFDYTFFESDAGKVGQELVRTHVRTLFEEGDGGAIIFKGEKFGLHTRVFLNAEGLPTYEAKEVGLAKIKKDKFDFDQSITITGNEQNDFFKVVQVAIGEVFAELKGKLKHLPHGMLRLTTGKMSSRTGDVITAESLIEEVKERVKGDEQVAVGAIKYMILRQAIGNDIVFDVEKSVSTEGDSGVYLQYAHARSSSILEKAETHTGMIYHTSVSGMRETHEIERLLYRFPEVVGRAGQEYAPHFITTYLTELAGSFNNFYAHEQVLDDSPESPYRLAIVKAFNIVMKNGLNILGIPAPEKM